MYCDLHGHSRKHNIFIYGCENRRQNEKRLQEQIFPLMLHKNSSEKVELKGENNRYVTCIDIFSSPSKTAPSGCKKERKEQAG